MKIEEIIVVEGRDDTAAVKHAVDAETIETHGFGLSDEMWTQIEKAYENRGIIVFTDPDRAGENIRRKIVSRFPDAGQAFLPREQAYKKNDIGVENASPEAIREALNKARSGGSAVAGEGKQRGRAARQAGSGSPPFTMRDMDEAGLRGAGSRKRREIVAAAIGIGYGNSKAMLAKLNAFGINREEFYEAVRSIDNQMD
jgi:ribonuclease M5